MSLYNLHLRVNVQMFPGSDNEMKYDNLARSLEMMMAELGRAGERVKNAESKVIVIEDELGSIGENQKQLEISEEKARRREEKYQVLLPYIHSQQNPLIILKEISATDTLHLLSAKFILNS